MTPIIRNLVALLPFSFTLKFNDGESQAQQQVKVESLAPKANYHLSKHYIGDDFFKGFDWKTIDDPTHGKVNYVSQTEARQKNLSYVSDHHTFVMRTDYHHKVENGKRGRDSVRIESKDTFENGVYILDLLHMPSGCGTWPAFWTSTIGHWPEGGEIDIMEGVDGKGTNQGTLHTTSGCTMPSNVDETGQQLKTDCAVQGANNEGCGVKDKRQDSFGPAFNKDNGGWYAMQRSNSGIKMWFWPRDGHPPADVKTGPANIDPSKWGKPFANFPSTHCDMKQHFGKHRIIINTSLCGDWAGAVYSRQGCPSTCEAHVMNDPAAFREAYWKIRGLRVYTEKARESGYVNDGDYSVDDEVVAFEDY
ncbi:uncharacterized protein I206_100632 [Kwoniella pini CBS 10737]|uniref:GH16 domain-containing protein n=1 Tax=Kwoniella pini CBS 10737 TaxID=1296096 RepID=A0A1B9ID98_9TREE|nr:uncharacterized protein I206_00693 [Kwoniella pini CBS 10737]OCF53391.1 hypothetical protein I206_00693 [Kwoniella pini CBS 10737]